MSLLKKLSNRLKGIEIKEPVVKHNRHLTKLATSIGLALTLGLTAVLGAGCGRTPVDPGKDPDDPKPPIVTPGGDPDYSNFSPTLQKVLKSEEYNNSIKELSEYEGRYMYEYPKINYHLCHPYGFLEKQGYSVNAIKEGYTECLSEAYTCEGNFYIKTMVAVYDNIPYYDCYVLEYNLTKQEQEDLDYLFNGDYYQAPFYVQQLSYDKSANVIGHAKHGIDTYKSLSKSFSDTSIYSKDILGTSNVEIIITDYDFESSRYNKFYTINLYTIMQGGNSYHLVNGKMCTLKMNSQQDNLGEICSSPTTVFPFDFKSKSSVKTITCYIDILNLNEKHNNVLNSSLTK